MGHHQIVQKWCVLFPDFVFLIDNPFFDSVVERFWKKKERIINLKISHDHSEIPFMSVPFSFGDPDMTKSESYFPSWRTRADNQRQQDGVRIPRQILMSHDHNGPMTYHSLRLPLPANQNWQRIQTEVRCSGSGQHGGGKMRDPGKRGWEVAGWFWIGLCLRVKPFLLFYTNNNYKYLSTLL